MNMPAPAEPTGNLRERVRFEKRQSLAQASPPGDGYGNFESSWVAVTTTRARIKPIRGGEQGLARKLQGVHLYAILVRASDLTRSVTTEMRAVNARTGVIYNIRASSNPDERQRFIEFICESGVADG